MLLRVLVPYASGRRLEHPQGQLPPAPVDRHEELPRTCVLHQALASPSPLTTNPSPRNWTSNVFMIQSPDPGKNQGVFPPLEEALLRKAESVECRPTLLEEVEAGRVQEGRFVIAHVHPTHLLPNADRRQAPGPSEARCLTSRCWGEFDQFVCTIHG